MFKKILIKIANIVPNFIWVGLGWILDKVLKLLKLIFSHPILSFIAFLVSLFVSSWTINVNTELRVESPLQSSYITVSGVIHAFNEVELSFFEKIFQGTKITYEKYFPSFVDREIELVFPCMIPGLTENSTISLNNKSIGEIRKFQSVENGYLVTASLSGNFYLPLDKFTIWWLFRNEPRITLTHEQSNCVDNVDPKSDLEKIAIAISGLKNGEKNKSPNGTDLQEIRELLMRIESDVKNIKEETGGIDEHFKSIIVALEKHHDEIAPIVTETRTAVNNHHAEVEPKVTETLHIVTDTREAVKDHHDMIAPIVTETRTAVNNHHAEIEPKVTETLHIVTDTREAVKDHHDMIAPIVTETRTAINNHHAEIEPKVTGTLHTVTEIREAVKDHHNEIVPIVTETWKIVEENKDVLSELTEKLYDHHLEINKLIDKLENLSLQHQEILGKLEIVGELSDKIVELIKILEFLNLEKIVPQLDQIQLGVNVSVKNSEFTYYRLREVENKISVIENLLEQILNQISSVEERDNSMHLIEEIKHTLTILNRTISPFYPKSGKNRFNRSNVPLYEDDSK